MTAQWLAWEGEYDDIRTVIYCWPVRSNRRQCLLTHVGLNDSNNSRIVQSFCIRWVFLRVCQQSAIEKIVYSHIYFIRTCSDISWTTSVGSHFKCQEIPIVYCFGLFQPTTKRSVTYPLLYVLSAMEAPLLPLSNSKKTATRHKQMRQLTAEKLCCCRACRNSIVTRVCCRPIVVAVVAVTLTITLLVSSWNGKQTYFSSWKLEASAADTEANGKRASDSPLGVGPTGGNYYRPDRFTKTCSVMDAGGGNYRQVMLNSSLEGIATLPPSQRSMAAGMWVFVGRVNV